MPPKFNSIGRIVFSLASPSKIGFTPSIYPIFQPASYLSPLSTKFMQIKQFASDQNKNKDFTYSPTPSNFATDSHAPSSTSHHHGHHNVPTNFYHIPPQHHGEHHHDEHHHEHHDGHHDEHHDDSHGPRGHLNKDGTVNWGLSSDHYHWYDPYRGTPPRLTETVNGVKMVKGVETRPMDELFAVSQDNLPFWPRTKMNFWGNHSLGIKIEFLFFWIPTFIIATLAIPCLTMIYMNEEAIFNTMTIKIIGRQWYWIYEVESPPDGDDDDDSDD